MTQYCVFYMTEVDGELLPNIYQSDCFITSLTHFGYLSLFDADTVYYLLGKQFHVMCKVKKKFTRGMNWL